MLEHVEDPGLTVAYWLDILKPGGGIGIVVPDWRYNWDARNDASTFGHKWNPTPALIRQLYAKYWSMHADLEALDTYPYRLSFDLVLRKHGSFKPFRLPSPDSMRSGRQRKDDGVFLHGE
jgi:hypothetical protein